MRLIRRPVWFRIGRFEVYAEDWEWLSGEPLIQTERRSLGFCEDFQAWMPGVHLVVSIKAPQHGEQARV